MWDQKCLGEVIQHVAKEIENMIFGKLCKFSSSFKLESCTIDTCYVMQQFLYNLEPM